MITIPHSFIWREGGFEANRFSVEIGYQIRSGKPVAVEVHVEVFKSSIGKHQRIDFERAEQELTDRVLRFANGSNVHAMNLRKQVLSESEHYASGEYAESIYSNDYGLTARAV